MIALSTHSQKTFLLDIDFLSFRMKDFEWTPCRYFLIFFILLSSSDLLFYKKNGLEFSAPLSSQYSKTFFPMFYSLVKREQKKEENILVGRREVQRGPIHFYAPVGEC